MRRRRVLVALLTLAAGGAFGVSGLRELDAARLVERAQARQARLDYVGALADLRAAVRRAPDRAEWHLEHGVLARTLWLHGRDPARRAEAEAAFAAAGERSPRWALPHFEQARLDAYDRRYGAALLALGAALARDPLNAGLWWERGRYLEALGRLPEARLAFGRCLALSRLAGCDWEIAHLGDPVKGAAP